MQLFKIANGPWEKLFSGSFQEHEVELYSNPEKILMVIVFEKKLDQVQGAIVELYKVFHASGEVEAFTETLPRDALILTKHDENSTMKFLLLGSKPTYARWNEQEFTKEIDGLVKRLVTSATMIKDVSKAYELNLQEIIESTPDVQTAFFTQPMLVPILSTSAHKMQGDDSSLAALTKGEIIIGLTRDKKRVVEPLALFSKVIVTEGEDNDRERVIQVLGESALLSNVPAIIFDYKNEYVGIGEASKNIAEIQKYDIQVDSLGFPIKTFKTGENLFVDVNLVNSDTLAELFGIGDKDFPRIVRSAIGEGGFTSIEELIDKIYKMKQTEEFSDFAFQKAARMLELMKLRYPKLFGGKNNTPEILKKGTSNIARTALLNLSELDERSSVLVTHSVLKGLNEHLKGTKETKSMVAMVLLPRAEIIASRGKQKKISGEIYMILNTLPKVGAGFVLGVKNKIDIDTTTKQNIDAKINIVSGNDIGVQLKNQKLYRVLCRPTLSKQKE